MSAIDAKPPLRTSLQRAAPLLGLVLVALAMAVVHRELDEYHYGDIMAAVAKVSWPILVFGLMVTVINYAALTLYDYLALRHLGKPLPAARVLVASLVGFAVSNNTGHALIAGTSLRYRFYGAFGLTAPDLVQLAIFLSITYLLGVATLAVGAWAWSPGFAATIPGADSIIHGAQYAALAALLIYWGAVILRRQPMQLRGYRFSLPSPLTTLKQTLVGAADLTLASLTLYIFLRVYVDLPFGQFLVFYLFAQLAGLYSQVPGGIGVFESVFILLARGAVPADAMVASLALYRVVYFFIPLAVAGAGLLAFEIWQQRSAMRQRGELITSLLTSLLGRSVPQIFALLLMLAGSVLLFSGATPTATGVAEVLRDVMPLPLMETSHLLGSLVGLLLLFFARAVWLRLEVAYPASVVLLLFGILFSLLKGFDWQEALILSAMLILFLPTRRYFYRDSALLEMPFTLPWFALIGLILGTSVWVGFFSYKHVEYADTLWWEFSHEGDVSRFLRASVTLGGCVIAFGLYRLLRVAPTLDLAPTLDEDREALLTVARAASQSNGYLALAGDKSILWSHSRRAFLMYRTTRKYWVAMADPLGDVADHDELVWRFRELADRRGAMAVFYQVSRHHLPLYLDMGLILFKLGEEALVSLAAFNLQGNRRSGFRHTINRMAKLGVIFRVLEQHEVIDRMAELRAVSDDWLEAKAVREKQFSLGFFSERYLSTTRVAVVELNGRIHAFANLWETDGRHEFSVDLMRHDEAAPPGVMDYLFIQLMLWGKDAGYRVFNLGMAPLAGLETHALAPLWHRIGNLIFQHGGDFYNFDGLHAYKEKFDPVWEPRYLAAPPGLSMPLALLTVTRLIAGNRIIGVFRK